jgi:glutamine synthetase
VSKTTVLRFAVDEQAKFADLKFTDLLGKWHHLTVPINLLTEESFDVGFSFDASSLYGPTSGEGSDLALIPDPGRFWIDPFYEERTLCLFAKVSDPLTGQSYEFDPRAVAARAQEYLRATGIADACYFGSGAEFFIFDSISYHNEANSSGYHFEPPKARRLEDRGQPSSVDSLHDLRSDIVQNLQSVGIEPEFHHCARDGRCQVNFRHSTLLVAADNVMLFKYVVKSTAFYYGKAATFMPQPLMAGAGSRLYCHQSLWKSDNPIFAGSRCGGLSDAALYYIGGILKHAPALAAFAAPTTNSYRGLACRDVPAKLAYSQCCRSAAIRIPGHRRGPASGRIQVCFSDPSCNPYLAFAAMLMAGIDGIKNGIDPGEPLSREDQEVPRLPATLDRALEALEADSGFLLEGGVFTEALIERWITAKREGEIQPMRMRPHPLEFEFYFDV